MTRTSGRRRLSPPPALVAIALSAAVAACEGPKQQVEILQGPRGEKGVVKVAASDEARNLFARLAADYASRRGVRFEIVEAHSKNVVEALDAGTADIGVVARRIVDVAKAAGMSYIPFAYDGVVFLVAPETKVRALTVAQIRRILEGKVRNWKEVGGADAEIRIIDRPPYSAARVAMASSLFGGNFPEVRNAITLETSDSVYHALRNIHSYFAYAPMSRIVVEQFPAVAVDVDGMPPFLSRVPFEKYPARLEYGIVFRKEIPAAVAEFVDFVSSVDGMHMLASYGVAPAAGKLSLSACHCRETESTLSPSRKSAAAGVFTIAVVPELGAIEQERRYSGIARLIADELGIRTQLRHLDTYDRVLEEFDRGRIDAAVVGSLAYGKLRARWGVIPIARPEKNGVSRYRGVIVARAGSDVRDVAGLRGKSLAFVPGTTAGDLFPRLLAPAAGGLARYFSRLVRAPSHSEAVLLVAQGRVDAAAVKDLVLQRMLAGSAELKARVQVVAASESVPENALVVHASLDPRLRERIRNVLLSAHRTEAGRRALQAVGADRFVPTAHEDYANLYAMAREAGFAFAEK